MWFARWSAKLFTQEPLRRKKSIHCWVSGWDTKEFYDKWFFIPKFS
jgi:hypothetical protein